MATTEWFRRGTWTGADQMEFEAHLGRARRGNRAQYLCIQAFHLLETNDERRVEAALGLFDRMLRDYPERIQIAGAHDGRAKCLVRLGRIPEALDAYRAALRQEREFPNVRT